MELEIGSKWVMTYKNNGGYGQEFYISELREDKRYKIERHDGKDYYHLDAESIPHYFKLVSFWEV
ncbi:MAG: hypothetical protein ACRCX2_01260 [Paraclostridium sp.]